MPPIRHRYGWAGAMMGGLAEILGLNNEFTCNKIHDSSTKIVYAVIAVTLMPETNKQWRLKSLD